MKKQLQEILDSLGEKTPRLRLAPYHEFILELRRREYTYREIRKILGEKCQVQVSISTLHDFLRAGKKQKRIAHSIAVSEKAKPRAKEKTPEIAPVREMAKSPRRQR